VSGIQQNDRGARAMERAYKSVLYSLLEENYWAFAIKRASLAEDTVKPLFGFTRQFTLPGDFIMLAPEDQDGDFPLRNDWQIEGGKILSNDSAPLDIRYVSNSVNESQFPSLFSEGFAAQLAVAVCEELTQSNTKLENAVAIYDSVINKAKKRNFIISPKSRAPVSPWISKRG